MLLSASFLSIKEDKKDKILKLSNEQIDFLHVDVMDGVFVSNKTECLDSLKKLLPLSMPFDVHLMVKDTISYIKDYVSLHPSYITIHVETDYVLKAIDFIKDQDIKVGLAINPGTPVRKLIPYLPIIDLVLVMSVEPGEGEQTFIENTVNKINELNRIRDIQGYHYVIEVDGGINERTAKLCKNVDRLVSGSYITNGNSYSIQIEKLKKSLDK